MSQKIETNGRSLDYWRQADVILPTQHHAGTRALGDPEHRLRFAVLEDAVHQFQRNVNAVGRRERALYEDVLDWFASENRSEPFSFESVCDALHIDPDFVRSRLRRWRDGARTRVSRSPRRVVTGRRTMSLGGRVLKGHVRAGAKTSALLVDVGT